MLPHQMQHQSSTSSSKLESSLFRKFLICKYKSCLVTMLLGSILVWISFCKYISLYNRYCWTRFNRHLFNQQLAATGAIFAAPCEVDWTEFHCITKIRNTLISGLLYTFHTLYFFTRRRAYLFPMIARSIISQILLLMYFWYDTRSIKHKYKTKIE